MGKLADKLYDDFNLTDYDFMGYTFKSKKELSYHHIVPRQYHGKTTYNNGALLCRDTSHNYIHLIEDMDFQLFEEISAVLKDEHAVKQITREHLAEINRLLEHFEKKNEGKYSRRGNLIIKEEYVRRRLIL